MVWAPHAGERREPEKQPGWRLGLEGFHLIDQPVTFEDLRANEDIIRVLESELEDRYGPPLYTPFETGQRAIRPKQAYLTKLPADLVDAFAALSRVAESEEELPETPRESVSLDSSLGESYRRPDESVLVSEADPFSRDPALVERALRSHAATQNALADFLESHGIEPLSPSPDEPNYDLSWTVGGATYVAEVKSLSSKNEERQLRLGLGQVLRYRQALGSTALAVVATSAEPTDDSWNDLFSALGVILVWVGNFSNLESRLARR